MTTVSISELRANLSRYVREVRRGGEVLVLERGTPVARLVSPVAEDRRGVRERLTAPAKGLGTAIHESFKPFGGVELDVPHRELMREPPRFE